MKKRYFFAGSLCPTYHGNEKEFTIIHTSLRTPKIWTNLEEAHKHVSSQASIYELCEDFKVAVLRLNSSPALSPQIVRLSLEVQEKLKSVIERIG